jgi:hypothetical protein
MNNIKSIPEIQLSKHNGKIILGCVLGFIGFWGIMALTGCDIANYQLDNGITSRFAFLNC